MRAHLAIIVLFYIVFAMTTLIGEIKEIKRVKTLKITTLCKLMYILLICIMPTIIYIGYLVENNDTYSIKYEDKYIWTFWMNLFLTIIAYVMFGFGTKIKQKKYEYKKNKGNEKIELVIIIYTIISCISLWKWASGFGGINALIEKANSIRAGFVVSSGEAFFKHLVPLAMLSSFLSFYKIFIEKSQKKSIKLLHSLMFIVSLGISLIFILANDGRMLAGIYILIFFLLILKKQYENNKINFGKMSVKIAIIGFLTIIVILNSDSIFKRIKGDNNYIEKNNNDFFQTISSEFSFIITGNQNALIFLNENEHQYMLKNDIINGLFAWFPTKLKPLTYIDVWDYNTMLINSKIHGQSPTTIVAQSIYDLGLLGIILIPMLYGYVVKKIQNYIESYEENVFFNTLYIILGFYLAKGVAYFSLYNIMMNIFFIVVGWIIYFLMYKMKLK